MSSGAVVPEVPAAGLPEEAYLLDVREPGEWAAGHAPGAVHIPLGELGAQVQRVPRDQTVYVICRSGVRSGYAAQALGTGGWNAVNVADGMQGWASAGRPMVSDSGAPPFVA
jgi:rhodanese-related sulfurtransferase